MQRFLALLFVSISSAQACPLAWEIAPFKTPQNVREEDFLPADVPGYWHLPARGYAVYRLRAGCDTTDLSLFLSEVSSAAQVYADGQVAASSGSPSEFREQERPRLAPWIIDFAGKKEFLIFVSNHNARSGGILGARTGKRGELELERKRSLLVEALLAGFLTASGLFFLLFYTVQKQPSYLPFSLLMFVCVLRSISSNAVLEEVFPDVVWTQLRLLLEYQTAVAWMPPLFFLVVYFVFAEETGEALGLRNKLSRFTAWTYAPAGLVLSIFFAASYDASFYGRFQPYYVAFYLLPGLALCSILLVLCIIEKRRGAVLLAGGFACVLVSTLADAESTVLGRTGPLFVPVGLSLFSLSFMIVAGIRLRGDQGALAESRFEMDRARREHSQSEQERQDRFEEFRKQALVELNAALALAEETDPPPREILARLHAARRRLEQAEAKGRILDLAALLDPDHPPVMIFARESALLALVRALQDAQASPVNIRSDGRTVHLRARAEQTHHRRLAPLAASAAGRLVAEGENIEILFAPASGESLSLEERHRLYLGELFRS